VLRNSSYSLHPDGQRFVVLMPPPGEGGPSKLDEASFVFNFFEELRRIGSPR